MASETSIHPLKKWRLDEGKTQESCADLVGVTRQTWIQWEKGANVPGKKKLQTIVFVTRGAVTPNSFYPHLSAAA